jgi:hypothetical protein
MNFSVHSHCLTEIYIIKSSYLIVASFTLTIFYRESNQFTNWRFDEISLNHNPLFPIMINVNQNQKMNVNQNQKMNVNQNQKMNPIQNQKMNLTKINR